MSSDRLVLSAAPPRAAWTAPTVRHRLAGTACGPVSRGFGLPALIGWAGTAGLGATIWLGLAWSVGLIGQ